MNFLVHTFLKRAFEFLKVGTSSNREIFHNVCVITKKVTLSLSVSLDLSSVQAFEVKERPIMVR